MNIRKKILNLGFMNRTFGKKVVHVEAPHVFGEELKKHLSKYKSKCYFLTPANYDYIDAFCGINMPKKEFKKYIKNYCLELKREGIDLQLHIHLSMFPELLPFAKKDKIIKEGYDFFTKELGIIPKEIVFGWYASDKESEEIAQKLNLKVRREHLHVYDWWMK